MTVPDPYGAGLDPAHIVAICGYATGGRHALAVGRREGICACLPSRQAARAAAGALARIGYRVAHASGTHGRDLLVTGWDAAGLESRLAAMRTVMHQLDRDPAIAARLALAGSSGGLLAPGGARELTDRAQDELHGWVFARSGVHAPRNPAVEPAELATALRLRATLTLEHTLDDLIRRQLRVAGQAVTLYGSLARQMGARQARATAIRWASITFHLSGSAAQDSSPLIQAAIGASGPRQAPPAGRQPRTRPVQPGVVRLPGAAAGRRPMPDAAAAPASPLRQFLPVSRGRPGR